VEKGFWCGVVWSGLVVVGPGLVVVGYSMILDWLPGLGVKY